jgi:type IV pilus assembly protein PilE
VRRAARGFTLVDLAVVSAIVGVLASVAMPSYQTQIAKGRRTDAIAALTRVQVEQEQFRAHHGSYALALTGLKGGSGALSPGGHYDIALISAHAGGFIARASPRDASLREGGCAELTVTVVDGQAVFGPSARCWNR